MKKPRNSHKESSKMNTTSYEAKVMRYSRNLGTGLTSIQHTALMFLCRYRHKLHAASEKYSSLPKSAKDELKEFFLNKMSILLGNAGLPVLVLRFFPIEQLENDVQRALYIDELNELIEAYLSSIDKTYGTMYCPTGYRRQKRALAVKAVRL